MEHGIYFSDNESFTKHVGYKSNFCMDKYFNKNTIKIISHKITELLQGVDPNNRKIVVTDRRIIEVMNDVFNNYIPPTGDIYSRYVVPSGTNSDNQVQNMIDEVIEFITSNVRNTLEIEENNKKLTIWTSVYGDFNQHSLRQHPPIKLRNKRPQTMAFNMNY